ncbi:hypothetical protein GGF46_000429 [Coemansia sp. RSA 552]|nr:hypothetical protein GGF46_000429 [Coemansia sp. RSA 552]
MSAPRQLVSYDDLFSDDEATPDTAHVEQARDAGVGGDEDDVEEDSNALAHPEAWDDSELVRAWDSTIGDYRKFHAGVLASDEYTSGDQHELESKVGQWMTAELAPSKKRRLEADNSASPSTGQSIAEWAAAHTAAPQSEEDALEKLNTAWYYVGYYAACYQGFRSAPAPVSAATQGPGTSTEPEAPEPPAGGG